MPRASATSHSADRPQEPGRHREHERDGEIGRADHRRRPPDQARELPPRPRQPDRQRKRAAVAGPMGHIEPRRDQAGGDQRRHDQRGDEHPVDPGAPRRERVGHQEEREQDEDVARPVDDDGGERPRMRRARPDAEPVRAQQVADPAGKHVVGPDAGDDHADERDPRRPRLPPGDPPPAQALDHVDARERDDGDRERGDARLPNRRPDVLPCDAAGGDVEEEDADGDADGEAEHHAPRRDRCPVIGGHAGRRPGVGPCQHPADVNQRPRAATRGRCR